MKKIGKKLINIWLVVMVILCLGAPSVNALPTVAFDLSDPAIVVGDIFDLNVYVTRLGTYYDPLSQMEVPDGVLAFGFDVDFVDTEFGYNGAIVASPFFDDSNTFPDTEVAGMAFPGVTGDMIKLASLSFTALQEGIFSLGIISDLSSSDNQGLFTLSQFEPFDITNNTEVTVTAAAPVPEPGTLLLIITGLGGLGFLKRKRS